MSEVVHGFKKCPYCDCSMKNQTVMGNRLNKWVICPACGAKTNNFKTHIEAIEAWNEERVSVVYYRLKGGKK